MNHQPQKLLEERQAELRAYLKERPGLCPFCLEKAHRWSTSKCRYHSQPKKKSPGHC